MLTAYVESLKLRVGTFIGMAAVLGYVATAPAGLSLPALALLFVVTVMAAGGVIASDAVRHPLEALSSPTRAGLLELVTALAPLAARWGK